MKKDMKKKDLRKITTAILLLLSIAAVGILYAEEGGIAPSKEYQVKAAFIYNFIKFIEWPEESDREREERAAGDTELVTIGIIGQNPFGDAFEAIVKKKIHNKKVVVKHFGGFEKNSVKYREDNETKYKYKDEKALKACQVLFIGSSERRYCKEIIDIVKDSCVLTVGETRDFLEDGGIVGFVTEEKKVRFGINLIAAKRADLTIRSKLLRLAKRVIKEEERNS
jgi:hypothetical protein